MELGIVGLPRSGKTTIFNALTKGEAKTTAYSNIAAPNIGVVKVPDPRLDILANLLNPKRTVPAEITYVDVAVPTEGFGKHSGPRGQFLSHLSTADALVYVVRAFENDSIPHCEGSINPERDIGIMNLELIFSDMSVIERRLERIKSSLKGAKQQERDQAIREQTLLTKIKSGLESDVPIKDQDLSDQDKKEIIEFQFLTAKPMLLLLNISEDQLTNISELESKWGNTYGQLNVAVLCGQLEMELSQLSDTDAEEFRANIGLSESGLNRMIRLSYSLLGLISFFTTASNELKAWTIISDTIVQKAAGKIHTDMERGFIRAEVIGYNDMVECGNIAEARKRGLLHVEGKSYIVKDGDLITVLFNV